MVVIGLTELILDDHDPLLGIAEKQIQRVPPDLVLALAKLKRQTNRLSQKAYVVCQPGRELVGLMRPPKPRRDPSELPELSGSRC